MVAPACTKLLALLHAGDYFLVSFIYVDQILILLKVLKISGNAVIGSLYHLPI